MTMTLEINEGGSMSGMEMGESERRTIAADDGDDEEEEKERAIRLPYLGISFG